MDMATQTSIPLDQISGFACAYELVARRLSARLRPPEPMPFSRWISENIVLIDGPHAGELWCGEGAPYLVEIADCLSDDHPCNRVTVRKSQQTGASVLGLAWCLYIAEREPANTLYAAPGGDALRDMNSRKLSPMIEAYEKRRGVRTFAPITSRDGNGSTTYHKKFPGGYLRLANANSVTDLSSATDKKGIKDEVSKWENIPGYGDPEELFEGRFTAFRRSGNYKILEVSTPEVDSGDETGMAEGHCRIDRSFRQSDQRYWHITCPHCHELFVQSFEHFNINEDAPAESVMVCPNNGCVVTEIERVQAVRKGQWKPTNPGKNRHPGFHIDAFCSLMMSYEAVAQDFIRAERAGEIGKKNFHNLNLGLPYAMRGDAPDHVRLMERREEYPENQVPMQAGLLVAGCDVQHTGLWVEIVAFASDRQSWCVSRRWLEGDTDVHGAGAWTKLAAVCDEAFYDAAGNAWQLDALGIDCGDGGRANQVYHFTRSRPRAHAVYGVAGWSAPAVGAEQIVDVDLDGKKIKHGARRVAVGTWSLKADLYSELRKVGRAGGKEIDPPGYCHFGQFLAEDYFKQLTSEYLITATVKGRITQRWAQRGDNHILDCRVYAKAMAEKMGLSIMTDDQWRELRQMRGLKELDAKALDLFSPAPQKVQEQIAVPEPSRKSGRRMRSKGILH